MGVKMKNRWTDMLGIILLLIFAYPAQVHARNEDFVATIVIAFVVSIVIFLILREFFCWYWKINENSKCELELKLYWTLKKQLEKQLDIDYWSTNMFFIMTRSMMINNISFFEYW